MEWQRKLENYGMAGRAFRNDEGGAPLSCWNSEGPGASSYLRQMRNECNLHSIRSPKIPFVTTCSRLSGAAAFILARFYRHLPPASVAASFGFSFEPSGMIQSQFRSVTKRCQWVKSP